MFELSPKETTSNVTLRFPDDLLDQVRTIALKSGSSISQFVFQACQYALDSMPKKEVKNNDSQISAQKQTS